MRNYRKMVQTLFFIARHSGESRNPGFFAEFWTPAFAGVTV
jgi:hypothetical protein